MYSNELYHFGKKGMRWGHRKSKSAQNLQKIDSKRSKYVKYRKSGMSTYDARDQMSTDRLNSRKNMADTASNIVRESKNISRNASSIKKQKSIDLSSMTDSDLRNRINRLSMEQQYSNLTGPGQSKGEAYVNRTLEVAGSALAITSSALAIALSIKQLKKEG